jgi:TrmH family RNA methyltransferase
MITSPSNPKVAYLRSLHAARGRAEARAFLVEGVRVVTAALDYGATPALALYEPELLARTASGRAVLARLLALARQGSCEVLPATERALVRASDTQTPAGLVAAVPLDAVAADRLQARREERSRPIVLLLDELADPGNMGTLLRSALAADVDEVWLTPGCVDVYSPKVVRAASGAHFALPLRLNRSWDACDVALAAQPGALQVLLAEAGGAQPYYAYDLTQPTCLIIGNEAHGPSVAARRLATGTLAIPLRNGVESLNAAIAASVVLFEALRQRCGSDGQTGSAPTP